MARTGTASISERRLRELMSHEPVSVTPEASLREVVELLAGRHIGGLPVVTNGVVAGVITASDILSFLVAEPPVPRQRPDQMEVDEWGESAGDEEPPNRFFVEMWEDSGAEVTERIREVASPEWDLLAEHTAAELMSRRVCSMPPDATASEAAAYMLRAGIHRVLVMEEDELLGIVTTTDILRAVAENRV